MACLVVSDLASRFRDSRNSGDSLPDNLELLKHRLSLFISACRKIPI